MYNFLTNFNYIWFFFYIFHTKTKYEIIIFLNIFFPFEHPPSRNHLFFVGAYKTNQMDLSTYIFLGPQGLIFLSLGTWIDVNFNFWIPMEDFLKGYVL